MKQAIILAAGEGQRLRPFTVNRPKVMLNIADKPILQHVIEALAQSGIRSIVLVVGYHKEQIFDAIGSGEQLGVDITYVTQEKQLGTAHALAQAKEAAEKEFLVLPGDNYITAETLAGVREARADTVVVKRVANPAGYGLVTVEQGAVKSIREKPRDAGGNLVNTGIYALTREIFTCIEEPLLDIPDVLNEMLQSGRTIGVAETGGTWMDAVYPWDMLNLNDAVLRGIFARQGGTVEAGAVLKGAVSVGRDTVVRSGSYVVGPVLIGAGCDIGPNACILPSTSIGNNVVVASFTEIKNAVISDDVNIGSGSVIHDSVIDRGCALEGRFAAASGMADVKVDGEYHPVEVGAMLGEGCEVGFGVVASPGTILGNYGKVRALKTIGGSLPDRSLVY
jgi:UDP-N-acetylglucosamine diphosphorylase / glucose-1-phosphate thymidylyltransferase / UDP-N-acetylgalactosamine diphosphorylase / glucosamine-1-phosphate N-acetyltransferase / galactosamine-1-phosphate N-acetyltransferase